MPPTRIIWRTLSLAAGLALALALAVGAPCLAQGLPSDGGAAIPPAIEPPPEAQPEEDEALAERLRAEVARLEAERKARIEAERLEAERRAAEAADLESGAVSASGAVTPKTPARPKAPVRPKSSAPAQTASSPPSTQAAPPVAPPSDAPPADLAPPGGGPVTVALAAKPAATLNASVVAVGVGLFLALLILAGLALQRILEVLRPKSGVKVFADPGEVDAPVFQREGPALSFDLGRGEAFEEAAYPAGAH